MASWVAIAAIAVMLLLSAFFSGSETALTAASRPRMHEAERRGDRRAELVNRLREKKERLIGAILLGNNLVNILASALATSVLIELFGKAGVAYATVCMTLLILIFAEVMPKTYAINQPEGTALAVAPVLRWVVWVLAPITHAVQVVVAGTLRLAGVKVEDSLGISATEEELRGAIALHESETAVIQDEGHMLRSILDLSDVEVGEIMTHRSNVVMVDADAPSSDIVAEVMASPYSRLPAWRDDPDNIIGVIHAKALLREVRSEADSGVALEIEKVLTPPWFIPEATSLVEQLRAFRKRHEHFAMVVDEYGSFMGVVTLEDILEEIVGDIADEHDVPVRVARPQPDGSYVVRGDTTIRDLNREFRWRLPDDDAATIAGLVMHEARRIPEVGQQFAFHGFRFEVMRRKKNQITLLKVSELRD